MSGERVEETLVVQDLGGTTETTITVEIRGRDDDAELTGQTRFEETLSDAALIEGQIILDDPDRDQDRFARVSRADLSGKAGAFTFNRNTGD